MCLWVVLIKLSTLRQVLGEKGREREGVGEGGGGAGALLPEPGFESAGSIDAKSYALASPHTTFSNLLGDYTNHRRISV